MSVVEPAVLSVVGPRVSSPSIRVSVIIIVIRVEQSVVITLFSVILSGLVQRQFIPIVIVVVIVSRLLQ